MAAKPPKPPKPTDRPGTPRFKDKQNQPKKSDIPIMDIDETRLVSVLPDSIKIAIADAVISFAAMERIIGKTIWDITGLSYDDGKLLTQFDISKKIDILKALVERYGLIIFYNRATTQNMWKALGQLLPVRNLIVHGVWGFLDGTTAVSISDRLTSTTGNVMGEPFSLGRLQAVTAQCYRIKSAFDGLSEKVQASPPIRPAPHRPVQSTPRKHPETGKK